MKVFYFSGMFILPDDYSGDLNQALTDLVAYRKEINGDSFPKDYASKYEAEVLLDPLINANMDSLIKAAWQLQDDQKRISFAYEMYDLDKESNTLVPTVHI